MKVRELMAELAKVNPDAEIGVSRVDLSGNFVEGIDDILSTRKGLVISLNLEKRGRGDFNPEESPDEDGEYPDLSPIR